MTEPVNKAGSIALRVAVGLVVVTICGVALWKADRPESSHAGEPLTLRAEPDSLTATNELPVISQVGDFSLVNQLNDEIGLDELRGDIWVADVIFTRCPGPCLKMTREMKRLSTQLRGELGEVRLVSITTDPKHDSPEVLGQYARRFEADADQWWFLTGGPEQLRQLAVRDLKFVVAEKEAAAREEPDDLFIHSTYFMVVDEQGRLRAVIEGAEAGAAERVVKAIQQLKGESE